MIVVQIWTKTTTIIMERREYFCSLIFSFAKTEYKILDIKENIAEKYKT
jgi:hypothetical protein